LGFVENAKGQVGSDRIEEIVVRELGNSETVKAQVGSDGIVTESENSGKLWNDSSGIEAFVENIERGVGEKANLLDGVAVSGKKEDAD
ncbi:hypothetical protein, partial [Klebsiella pneumoniae]|uniref:hypothetical protein n=1 Tax=Klebsiella pneumoniae TaxID=573 RepID=UPI00301325C6